MKMTGLCNMFLREVEKDGKVYHFPELSISSTDKDGNWNNINVKCNFKKELGVDVNELDACYGYQLDIKDSIVNVETDNFRKQKVITLCILDFEFKRSIQYRRHNEEKKESTSKNPFKK